MPDDTRRARRCAATAVAIAIALSLLAPATPALAAGADGEHLETGVINNISDTYPTNNATRAAVKVDEWRGNCVSTDNCRVSLVIMRKTCALCGWGELTKKILNGSAGGTDTDVVFSAPSCGTNYYRVGMLVEEYTQANVLRDIIRYWEMIVSGSYETIVNGVAKAGGSIGSGEHSRTTESFVGGRWERVTRSEFTSNGTAYEIVGTNGNKINHSC